MKTVILAGGMGTRLSEETNILPKPMIELGTRPILWHIMKIYSHWGFNEFIVLTGYKSHIIKDFFINYYTRFSDITVDMAVNTVELHRKRSEDWKVTMLYTGADTMTGGRLLKAREYIGGERFMLTYGDGVADINIPALLSCHEKAGKIVTLTAVRPAGRFGELSICEDGVIDAFQEKPETKNAWINGGFFVMESSIFDRLTEGDATILEAKPLETLAREGNLNAYRHRGFWRPMDTLRDKNELNEMWKTGKASWALWLKN